MLKFKHRKIEYHYTEKQIIDFFLSTYKQSPNTLNVYHLAIERFVKFIYPKSLNNVTWRDIEKYKNNLTITENNKKSLAPSTITTYLAPIRSLYKWGSDPNINLLKYNPTTVVKSPKFETKSERKNFLTKKELSVFLDKLKNQSNRNYLMAITMVFLGLRVSELTSIIWEDFYKDPMDKSVWLDIPKGKGGKRREVKTPAPMWKLIKQYRKTFRYTNQEILKMRLFPVSTRQVQRIIKDAGEQCNLYKKVTPHSLRHTNATMALIFGATLQQVQQNLGHSEINTTQHYLHTVELIDKAAPDYIVEGMKDIL